MVTLEYVWFADAPDTPLGQLWVAASANGVAAVQIGSAREDFLTRVRRLTGGEPIFDPERLSGIIEQLGEYLGGERREFDLPIDWSLFGPFQEQVLRITYDIPYGSYRIYGDIAREIGKENAARAVGRALATNPIGVVIPCHRVIGKDGKLHGYAAPNGIASKAWLLKLEGAALL